MRVCLMDVALFWGVLVCIAALLSFECRVQCHVSFTLHVCILVVAGTHN